MERITDKKWFYIVCFLLFFSATLFIFPLADDWYYKTAPHIAFDIAELLPAKSFWRPLDALFGFVMGLVPKLFPYLNRAVVVLGHVINVYILKEILICLKVRHRTRNLALCFTMFSSGVYAAVISPDALNQVYSLLFGLLALLLYLKKQRTWVYILLSAVSVFWKESGIVWICLVPFIDIMLSVKSIRALYSEKKIRNRILKAVGIAFAFVIIYFTARFALYGEIRLGSSGGKYALSLFSVQTLVNLVNIFGNALAGIDTVALFAEPANYILVALTALLSLVFIIFLFLAFLRCLKQKHNRIPLITLIISMIVVSAPHIIMGQAGEMHVYPTVFMTALLIGFIFDSVSLPKKQICAAFLCIFLAFGISGAHKLTAIYGYSEATRELTQQMYGLYDPSKSLLIISADEAKGYSIYSQPAIYGAYYGDSLRPCYGWEELDIDFKKTNGTEDLEACIRDNESAYDVIWVVSDDKITVVEEDA